MYLTGDMQGWIVGLAAASAATAWFMSAARRPQALPIGLLFLAFGLVMVAVFWQLEPFHTGKYSEIATSEGLVVAYAGAAANGAAAALLISAAITRLKSIRGTSTGPETAA